MALLQATGGFPLLAPCPCRETTYPPARRAIFHAVPALPAVKPTVTHAATAIPNGGTLALLEHDGHYYLQLNGTALQNSFAHGVATELARLGCAPFRPVRQPRILLAGLGLGYTLAMAREALPQKRATFVVGEPIADVPDWHRRFLEELHPGQLDDSRVLIRPEALPRVLRETQEVHAILLDADGGSPQPGLTTSDGFPESSFLHLAQSTLKEGGLLAVACSNGTAPLERRLRQAGFDVAHEPVSASHKGKQKRRSSIWLARKGTRQN